MARIQYQRLRVFGPSDLEESPTESELEAPPRRLGAWAKAVAVACGVGLLGGAAMLLRGKPVKADAQSAVDLALIGHNSGGAQDFCLAIESSISVYKDAYHWVRGLPAIGRAAHRELHHFGHKYVKGWRHAAADDADCVSWWSKDRACVISFEGSDSAADFINDERFTPISNFGLRQVHAGLSIELFPLLGKMEPDFPRIKAACDSVMVTGHSLGGGLAQLFTLVINRRADFMKAGFKVDSLYAFGAMPVSTRIHKNDQSNDGCFAGALYFTARRDRAGKVLVDVVKGPNVGAPRLKPIKHIKKVLLFEVEAPIEYPCGEDLPAEVEPCGDMQMHDPRQYASRLGCGYIDGLRSHLLQDQ